MMPHSMLQTVHQRRPFLESVRECAVDRSALQSKLGVSRSTVRRALDKLTRDDLVSVDDAQVQITLVGELLVDGYETFESHVAATYDLPPTNPAADELVETILSREFILEHLGRDGNDKRTLVEELPASRSKINRSVRDLEALELVAYRDGEFHLTERGRSLYEGWKRLQTTVESIHEARPLLVHLALNSGVTLALVKDADVVLPPQIAPHMIGTRLDAEFEETIRCRALARAHSHASSMDTITTQVFDEELDLQCVLSADIDKYLRAEYPDILTRLSKRSEILILGDDIPYGLFVLDQPTGEAVWVLVYSEENALRGAIVNNTPASLRWASRIYRNHEEQATPIDVTDETPAVKKPSPTDSSPTKSHHRRLTNQP